MSLSDYKDYEVIVDNRYRLGSLIETVTLEESLDEIAYRGTVSLAVTPDLPSIRPGQEIRISGIPYGSSDMVYLLHPGVVWECENNFRQVDRLDITLYDRTIYLAKSEDEYAFPSGLTASQRLRQYANDWEIPLHNVPDTGILLARQLYRTRPIYSMLMDDLKETVKKGGAMYRPRMTPNGLELFALGSNRTVWSLKPGDSVETIVQRRTLEGTVTKVKVLGSEENPDKLTEVLAVESGDTERFGTLQKVVMDSTIKTIREATTAARGLLSGIQETISVTASDINTMRAGDRVELVGSGMELFVVSIRHELGPIGKMTLELATPDYIKRRYFLDGSV